jgi:Protein of unknown function (DUF3363)
MPSIRSRQHPSAQPERQATEKLRREGDAGREESGPPRRDHWNTDNPHIHVLIRGRADNRQDLVISRDYVSNGLAGAPRSESHWSLGRAASRRSGLGWRRRSTPGVGASSLRDISDEGGGVIDLRPGDSEDSELRRLIIGRAAKLGRLDRAEQVGPARWTLKPGLEPASRDLGIRGAIIKAMQGCKCRRPRARTSFALHGEEANEPVLDRLLERGLHDKLRGTAMRSSKASKVARTISSSRTWR